MDLYIYMVIHANIHGLKGHLQFVNTFLRNELLKSTKGYYLATLEAALEFVEELNDSKLSTQPSIS